MIKLIVIVGPTASSKSSLALKLAKQYNGEIISCDAFQIYKELNSGVNKPTNIQLEEVKHHFINSHSIYDKFDIEVFQNEANKIIDLLVKQNKNIILCGGSNLYIDALIKGYDFSRYGSRKDNNHFDNWTYDEIYNYVLEKDPQEALKIHKNNKKRIIRAAQIIYETKSPKSNIKNKKCIYNCYIINMLKKRDELYDKINRRVDEMLNSNWYSEVLNLYNNDKNITNLQAFKAIGYSHILDAIITNSEIDINKIKQLTRNYAKRQITWNKSKYDISFNYEDNYDELVLSLNTWFKSN